MQILILQAWGQAWDSNKLLGDNDATGPVHEPYIEQQGHKTTRGTKTTFQRMFISQLRLLATKQWHVSLSPPDERQALQKCQHNFLGGRRGFKSNKYTQKLSAHGIVII